MFLNTPVLAIYGADKWRLVEDLDYYILGVGKLRIPHGFITDLASVPTILRSFFPVNDLHRAPAILHDWCYSTQGRAFTNKPNKRFSRLESDKLFLHAMKECGVGYTKRNLIYLGVRLGGKSRWEVATD